MSRWQRKHRDEELARPFALQEQGTRVVRLEHLLFEEIDRLFRQELVDRRVQRVVPTSVRLSPDLRNARVNYALRDAPGPGRERELREGLERVKAFLRARVAEALSLKRTPDLHFHRDRMAEASLRAEAVMLEERTAPLRAATRVEPEQPEGGAGPGDGEPEER